MSSLKKELVDNPESRNKAAKDYTKQLGDQAVRLANNQIYESLAEDKFKVAVSKYLKELDKYPSGLPLNDKHKMKRLDKLDKKLDAAYKNLENKRLASEANKKAIQDIISQIDESVFDISQRGSRYWNGAYSIPTTVYKVKSK